MKTKTTYPIDLNSLVATLRMAGMDIHVMDMSGPPKIKEETADPKPQNSPAPVDISQPTCYTAGMKNQTTEPAK